MKPRVIVHPILIGLYPVLFAYAHNMDFAPPIGEIVMLLALFGCAAALLWGALALVTANPPKAAIAVSLFIILFFSYGHLANLMVIPLWDFKILSVGIGHIKVLACLWIVTAWFATRWLLRASLQSAATATVVLNRAGMALVVMGVFNLVATEASGTVEGRHQHGLTTPIAASVTPARDPGRSLPDIYYIILDDYARPDILKELYGYDETGFVNWLKDEGFYVADRSHSNYSQTMLSLASSLNSSYLEAPDLVSALSQRSKTWHVDITTTAAQYLNTALGNVRVPLAHMIQDNSTVRTLKAHGYRFVAFTSGYGGVQMPTADVVMQAQVLDDFEESLISTTPIPDVIDHLYDPLEHHRERVRYVFDHLGDRVDDDSKPMFVFAHILCPHLPFAFEADGSPVKVGAKQGQVIFDDTLTGVGEANREALIEAYRGQVEFVNRNIEHVVDQILRHSRKPPIIVLQSDHGSEMTLNEAKPSSTGIRERMSILNAYYVPDEIRAQLYPEISPVNTFGVILGNFFAGATKHLADESFLSKWQSPYDFVPVTDILHSAEEAAQPHSAPHQDHDPPSHVPHDHLTH